MTARMRRDTMAPMAWVEATVMQREQWAPGLVSLKLDQTVASESGQFINLALDLDGERVKRPYSLASASDGAVEVYLSSVAGGRLSPYLVALQVGQKVWLDTRATGFFTLQHVPSAPDLWLMASGTGLGPFVSMLRGEAIWRRAERIVVVHGVRDRSQLGYGEFLRALVRSHSSRLSYVPALSRENAGDGAIEGRIPRVIGDGLLGHTCSFVAIRQ
jgi:ferredoxin/flavodoxin---NADP+ reductase